MNLILFTKRGGKSRSVCLTEARCYLPVLGVAAAFVGMTFLGGYMAGRAHMSQRTEQVVEAWRSDVARQQVTVAEARDQAQAQIDALSRRLGRLQAHIIRLDALGKRLTSMANLAEGEFDFDQSPAQGGPEHSTEYEPVSAAELMGELRQVSSQLADRESQLAVLESLLRNRRLQAAVEPTGRPIDSGWLSSYYGWRTDPFSGKRERHHGVDFAGKKGSPVVAVAAGVVTWVGERYGYGDLVEIDHGNGYVTRYGHNAEHLVEVGERVEKGQQIARMGSTGRSTGPHVHFEVRYNGRPVNPSKYIRAGH